MYPALLQGEALTKEQHIMVRTSLPIKGWLRLGSIKAPLVWLKLPLSAIPICSRGSPCLSAQCLDTWMLPGPVEYIDSPDTPAPFPMVASAAYKEEAEGNSP